MAFNEGNFQDIMSEFAATPEFIREVAMNFQKDLQVGLRDPKSSSMRMLKSYVGLPTGNEKGEFLALDFGGTNVRVLKIKLEGEGRFEVIKKVGEPLIVPGKYDYIGKNSTADEMFGFLARLIDEAIDGDHNTKFYLGHTFSFPSTQDDLNNAKLIIWTKEFATPGVEGKVVNDLLLDALKKRGIENVVPVAVINDTVAVLLSSAYQQSDVYTGSIYATGHNTCYLEGSIKDPKGFGKGGMILNLECGNFMKLTPNRFDIELDKKSEKPGEQRFEKMVSGRYMGELFTMAVAELLDDIGNNYGFTSIDMSAIVSDESENLAKVAEIVKEKTGADLEIADLKKIKELDAAIIIRSARLVTASYVGIVWQRANGGEITTQHVAVDGSVYEKMPLVQENINKALRELLGDDAAKVDTILDNGGSGLGAALAAAMAVS